MKPPSIRFGLRTVAVVTVVSAIACALLAMIARQVERQKKISKTIVSVGGEVFHSHVVERRDSVTPKWLLEKLGIDTFEGLAQIQLERTDIESIDFLSGLTGVKNLYLDRTRIHDLTPIAKMKSLNLLSIDETKVTDLTAIKDLTNLHVLSIDHTKIDDLKPLHGLKQLTTLYAHRIAAPESEFNALRKALPNLKVNP